MCVVEGKVFIHQFYAIKVILMITLLCQLLPYTKNIKKKEKKKKKKKKKKDKIINTKQGKKWMNMNKKILEKTKQIEKKDPLAPSTHQHSISVLVLPEVVNKCE